MRRIQLIILAIAVFFTLSFSAQAKNLRVIATIKPLHSLIANIMGDKGDLQLLVNNGLDPHIFRLRPSNIRQIQNSDVLFYIDTEIETFLKNILRSKYGRYMDVPMARQKNMNLVPYRTTKVWYQDDEIEAEQDHHDDNSQDMHIWLDPANARLMILVITEVLSNLDPNNRLTYIQNSQKTIAKLYNMEEDIREKLRPFREKPMIVYHDAFQYYEKAFGLKSVGAILLRSDQTPSVKHIKRLKQLAKEKKVTCVLGVPGSHPKIATVVMSGTNAGYGIVDPLGLYLDEGPNLYFDMMEQIAQTIIDCQGNQSKLENSEILK